MFKVVLPVGICLLAAGIVYGQTSADEEWASFKAKFGKVYASPLEEANRRGNFEQNSRLVNSWNKETQESNLRFGVKNYSDLSIAEISQLLPQAPKQGGTPLPDDTLARQAAISDIYTNHKKLGIYIDVRAFFYQRGSYRDSADCRQLLQPNDSREMLEDGKTPRYVETLGNLIGYLVTSRMTYGVIGVPLSHEDGTWDVVNSGEECSKNACVVWSQYDMLRNICYTVNTN